MNRKNWIISGTLLGLFLMLILIAILVQSAYLLYAASLLPVGIVPFLPDLRSNQWLKRDGDAGVDLYLLKPEGATKSEFLVLEFAPKKLKWNKQSLYFPVTEEKYPVLAELKSSDNSSATVLPYDLSVHPRKQGWYQINLRNLKERVSSGLPVTTNEIGRILIRLDDLRAVANPQQPITAIPNKGLEA